MMNSRRMLHFNFEDVGAEKVIPLRGLNFNQSSLRITRWSIRLTNIDSVGHW
jgi:hypothetical protein